MSDYLFVYGTLRKRYDLKLKDKVKKDFMAFLYSAPEKDAWGRQSHVIAAKEKLDIAFRTTYPEVYAFINAIKTVPESLLPFMELHYKRKRAEHRVEHKRLHPNYAYLNLPSMMQRIESFMLRKISKKLFTAGIPPFVTVHDSWILFKKDAERAEEIIIDCYRELGVIPPKVKQECISKNI